MKNKFHILLTTMLIPAAMSVYAELPADDETEGKVITFRQSFGIGSEKVLPGKDLLKFGHEVDSLVRAGEVGNVNITGMASVDGSVNQNENLANGRAVAMKDWLSSSSLLDANKILLKANGNDWNLFRRLVAEDPDVPSKEKALSIIDSDSSETQKNYCLKKLSGGVTWRYLARNIFPKMRVAIVNLEMLPQQYREYEPESAVGNQVEIVEQPVASSEMVTESYVETDVQAAPVMAEECHDQRMALKSNILYDAALMPSLELEYKFNNRWSVGLEGNVAWWKNDPKHKYYQIATIIPEVRYHLNPDKKWSGHYLGLFAGGGKYDLENGKTGYYGEGGMLGISYNYLFNVGKYISFEAGLGVGAMYTRYKEYIPVNGKYLYQQTKHMWYGGPLRVKFAIVWRFWDKKCKGGDK